MENKGNKAVKMEQDKHTDKRGKTLLILILGDILKEEKGQIKRDELI